MRSGWRSKKGRDPVLRERVIEDRIWYDFSWVCDSVAVASRCIPHPVVNPSIAAALSISGCCHQTVRHFGLTPHGSPYILTNATDPPVVEFCAPHRPLPSSTALGYADGLWLANFGAGNIDLSFTGFSIIQGRIESGSESSQVARVSFLYPGEQ